MTFVHVICYTNIMAAIYYENEFSDSIQHSATRHPHIPVPPATSVCSVHDDAPTYNFAHV